MGRSRKKEKPTIDFLTPTVNVNVNVNEFYYLLSIIILINLLFCIEIAPVCVCGGESCSEFRFANFRGNSNVGKLSNKIPHRKIDTYSPLL